MRIFDCHCHLPRGGTPYDLAGVSVRNVVFNSLEEYASGKDKVQPGDSISLVFEVRDERSRDFIFRESKKDEICALKITTREQGIREEEFPALLEGLKAFGGSKPVIYDAFYYGPDLSIQPSLQNLISLCTAFPDRPVIVAHAGGHKVLEYFLHLRPLKNVRYDLSFSLQYLHDSSAFTDLVKLIRHTDPKRILFGSDFDWASPARQFEILSGIFDSIGLDANARHDILYANAASLFQRG